MVNIQSTYCFTEANLLLMKMLSDSLRVYVQHVQMVLKGCVDLSVQ